MRGLRLLAPELPLFTIALLLLLTNSGIRLLMPNYQALPPPSPPDLCTGGNGSVA